MRRFSMPRHSTVAAYTALTIAVIGGGGAAYAATNGYVHLGQTNTEFTSTTIQRATSGNALTLRVENGSAPLSVNSRTQVGNLNASYVDGKTASSFQPKLAHLHYTNMALQNGWTTYSGSRDPGLAMGVDGIVHFKGAMYTAGTNSLAFTLPAGYRPSSIEYIPVDECDATTGRLIMYPTGQVYVAGDPSTTYANSAGCFTSLDGASYAIG